MAAFIIGAAPSLGAEAGAPDWQELCASGSLQELREVLRTASADALLPGGNRPLHVAVEHASDPAIIDLLLKEGASLSSKGLEGLTPLMLAAAYNPNPSIAEALMRAGASWDIRDASGRTSLHLAAAMNPSPKVAEALIKAGASVKNRDNEGRTPLWLAASRSEAGVVKLLLEAGAPADEANRDNVTPLQAACASLPMEEAERSETLRLLLRAGANANHRDPHRYTPAMRLVAAGGDAASLRALAGGGADLLAEDDQNRTALFLAVSNLAASTDVVAMLSDLEGPDTRESSLLTPLMEASRANNLPAVRLLLARGANPSLRDRNDWTPLMFAAASNAVPELLKALAEGGADLEAATRQGLTPLMVAIEAKARPETLKALTDLGANLNHKNAQDITPLMMAAAEDRTEAIAALLAGGADPNLGTWDGLTPLMIAARRSEVPEIFRSLAKAGASIDQRTRQGMTALMIAAASGNETGVEELLALSADVSLRDMDGMTPLFHAVQAQGDNAPILERLLQAGANPDAPMARDMTPLMDAALRSSPWAVKVLLEAGAKPDAPDFIRWTPLHFAARGKGGTECLALLLSKDVAPDLQDSGGTTPLMIAAACDNAPAVEMLLNAGADPMLADRTGRDALGYARLRNSRECIPILEKRVRRTPPEGRRGDRETQI